MTKTLAFLSLIAISVVALSQPAHAVRLFGWRVSLVDTDGGGAPNEDDGSITGMIFADINDVQDDFLSLSEIESWTLTYSGGLNVPDFTISSNESGAGIEVVDEGFTVVGTPGFSVSTSRPTENTANAEVKDQDGRDIFINRGDFFSFGAPGCDVFGCLISLNRGDVRGRDGVVPNVLNNAGPLGGLCGGFNNGCRPGVVLEPKGILEPVPEPATVIGTLFALGVGVFASRKQRVATS
jgi:hypothetical protein